MAKKVLLSERIRPNSEAAPWVIDEVKELEDVVFAARELRRDATTYNYLVLDLALSAVGGG